MNAKEYNTILDSLNATLENQLSIFESLNKKDKNQITYITECLSEIVKTEESIAKLKQLFGKAKEDVDGNSVLKDEDGCIQWRF